MLKIQSIIEINRDAYVPFNESVLTWHPVVITGYLNLLCFDSFRRMTFVFLIFVFCPYPFVKVLVRVLVLSDNFYTLSQSLSLVKDFFIFF